MLKFTIMATLWVVDYFSALIFVGFYTKEKEGFFDFVRTYFVNVLFDGLFILLSMVVGNLS